MSVRWSRTTRCARGLFRAHVTDRAENIARVGQPGASWKWAKPKSVIHTFPRKSINRFAGLMSR